MPQKTETAQKTPAQEFTFDIDGHVESYTYSQLVKMGYLRGPVDLHEELIVAAKYKFVDGTRGCIAPYGVYRKKSTVDPNVIGIDSCHVD